MQALVSIITPYRNASKFLPRFVSSMQSQTRTDWICLMIDDGSTDDGPTELARLVAADCRFTLIKNTSPKYWPGPASARNCALSLVNTSLVAFCDVDDLWHPRKLEYQLYFHRANNLDLSVSAYGRFLHDRPSDPIRTFVCPPANLDLNDLYGRNPIPMLTVIMSSDLVGGGFFQVPHEDFLFWLELFRANPSLRYGCLPTVLGFYCIHRDNLSSQKASMPIWTYRVFRNFGLSRTSSLVLLLSWISDHLLGRPYSCFLPNLTKLSVCDLLEMHPLHLEQDVLSSS